MFHVPTNTEITSGSLSWECLVFISWRSWQKASRFWKTQQPLSEFKKNKQTKKNKLWIPVNLLPVHSQTSSLGVCCDGCQQLCAPWQGCFGTWRSEGLTCNKHASRDSYDKNAHLKARGMSQSLKRKCLLTPVLRDPLYTKWTSLLVKEQHSCVHIYRNSLPAVPHHLHLEAQRNVAV